MIITCLKEVKKQEGRVALIPDNVKELVASGHTVLMQKDAGIHVGFTNEHYTQAGAQIIESTEDCIAKSDLVVKVKEPTIDEVKLMKPGQMFFGYLHLAAIPETLQTIVDQKIKAIGFETVELEDGRLPLLSPMSEIAGKLASQNGAHILRFDQGGRGVLLGGTETVEPGKVVILGGGVVGRNAAMIAVGLGAETTILDLNEDRLKDLHDEFEGELITKVSTPDVIEEEVMSADLVVGAVLVVGKKAPHLVTEDLVKRMKKGSVIVDVSVDQGGCVQTSEVTTHQNPTVTKHGVLHYGVANMPGSVPVTSTLALNHASFKYIKALADLGYDACVKEFPEMKRAVNCEEGRIVHAGLEGVI